MNADSAAACCNQRVGGEDPVSKKAETAVVVHTSHVIIGKPTTLFCCSLRRFPRSCQALKSGWPHQIISGCGAPTTTRPAPCATASTRASTASLCAATTVSPTPPTEWLWKRFKTRRWTAVTSYGLAVEHFLEE